MAKSAPRIDRDSNAYHRVVAAGFSIGDAEYFDGHYIRIPFTCVCGRTEQLNYIGPHDPSAFDVAAIMEEAGALSVEHLRADGYSEIEIEKIRRPYGKS